MRGDARRIEQHAHTDSYERFAHIEGSVAPVKKQEAWAVYVSTNFCGRPIGQKLTSGPNREAVTVVSATD